MNNAHRFSLATTARQTSYAPATAPLAAPPQSLTHATQGNLSDRKSKRDRESSPETSPSRLARRAQPLTPGVGLGSNNSSNFSASRLTPGTHGATAGTAAPAQDVPSVHLAERRTALAPQPPTAQPTQAAALPAPHAADARATVLADSLPMPVLGLIAAYAAENKPWAYMQRLAQEVGQPMREESASLYQHELMRHRPEVLLQIPAASRTTTDYQIYLEAGGTLENVPAGMRNAEWCDIALAHSPRALEHVPDELRTAKRCLDAVRRDGAMLAFVPDPLLAEDSAHREELCDAAYFSPRAPRIRHVPDDLLTPERYQASLKLAPLDLPDVPEDLRTEAMCVAAILAAGSAAFYPDTDAIPERLFGTAVAEAMVDALQAMGGDLGFPSDDWLRQQAHTSEKVRRYWRNLEPINYMRSRQAFLTPAEIVSIMSGSGQDFGVCSGASITDLVALMQRAARSSSAALDQPVPDPSRPGTHALKNLSDNEIWRWALRTTASSFSDAPAHIRAEYEIARVVVINHSGYELEHVPVDTLLAHPDLVTLGLKPHDRSYESVLNFLPKEIWQHRDRSRLQALCSPVLPLDRHALAAIAKYAPDLMTDAMYAMAAYGGNDLSLIPKRLHEALREQAVRKNGLNLQHIPEAERSVALCRLAVASAPQALQHVPRRHLSRALVTMALAKDPTLLWGMDARFGQPLPDSLYLQAVTEWGASLGALPRRLCSASVFRTAIRRHPQQIQNLAHEQAAWAQALMLELLEEDPERIFHLADGYGRVDWAVHAYRHGASLQDAAQSLSGPLDQRDLGNAPLRELMAAIQGLPYRADRSAHSESSDDEAGVEAREVAGPAMGDEH